jgi:ribonuclease HI
MAGQLIPNIELYFDGSTKGSNPGIGGAGAVIISKGHDVDDGDSTSNNSGTVISTVSNRMGFVGNNCAEYYGLILGLRELLHCFPDVMEYNLKVMGDSELVIKQLSGEYEIRNNVLINYYMVACGLVKKVNRNGASFTFVHIPREQNTQADALAKVDT